MKNTCGYKKIQIPICPICLEQHCKALSRSYKKTIVETLWHCINWHKFKVITDL